MLNDLLHLSYVKRWIISDMIREQSVAEHSFRVAVITERITAKLGIQEPERSLAMHYALTHDIGEVNTGDAPAPSKNDSSMDIPLHAQIVKVADQIEALTWVIRHGNRLSHRTMKAITFTKDKLERRVRAFRCSFPDMGIAVAEILEEINRDIER